MTDEFPPDDTVEVLDMSELIDAHLDAQSQNDFENEIPTVVEVQAVCPGCGKEQVRLEAYEQPPASHAESWQRGPARNGKRMWDEGACRGNAVWYWCRTHTEHGCVGTLVIVNKPGEGGMFVFFFPDRRIEKRPVPVERRGLPPGTPSKGKP